MTLAIKIKYKCKNKKGWNMNKALTIIWTIALIVASFAFATVVTQNQAERMAQYAAEHNCRYDYNDLCYTKEQKPWLFE